MKLDTSLIGHSSQQAARDAAAAERSGFTRVWATESVTDAFLQSLAIAMSTSSIEIGTAIAVAFSRNPMSAAYAAWDISAASQGRFTVGLGTQVKAHVTRRFSMPWTSPVDQLTDFIGAMRAIFEAWRNGTRLNYEGTHYSHTLMTPVFTPPHHEHDIPIAIAAVGARMTELAGRICDGVILHGMTHPGYLDAVTLPALQRGLAESSSPDRDFFVSIPLFMVMGDNDEQLDKTMAETRKQIAFYASTPAYKGVIESLGYDDLQPRLQALSRAGKWDDMATLIDDTILNSIAVVGSPEDMPRLTKEKFGDRFDRVSSYYGWPFQDPDRMRDIVRAFDQGDGK